MTGKYTILMDGNFWLHKTFHIGQKIKTGKPFNFIDEPEADKNLLLWKLSVDFAAEIKRFEGITHRIVYCIDSSSWRKKVVDANYKGNREYSNKVDWSAIYKVHDEFIASLEKLGVVISRVTGAEADDLIFIWSSLLNQKGNNAIIISGDNDLLQLVNLDTSSGSNTIYYNKFDKDLHVFPKFQSWLNTEPINTTNDIFNLPKDLLSNTKEHLREIIKANKTKIDEVNVMEFIFKKILIGDSGDNVPPLHTKVKETKKGPITYRVTDKHAEMIYSKFIENKMFVKQNHLFSEEYIQEICEIANNVLKIESPVEDTIKKWKSNRDLMYLHINCIPSDVMNSMMDNVDKKLKRALSAIEIYDLMNKDKILEGTTYTKDKKTNFNESNLFKPISASTSDVKIIEKKDASFNNSFWDDLIK